MYEDILSGKTRVKTSSGNNGNMGAAESTPFVVDHVNEVKPELSKVSVKSRLDQEIKERFVVNTFVKTFS